MSWTLTGPVLACTLLAVVIGGCSSDPYQLDATSAGNLVGPRFTQTARPTRCPADAQPAIIGVHGPQKTPEWGCLLACAVKQEYVTDVTRTMDDTWYLAPGCQFVCDANEHRLSYLDFDHQAHCAPGAVTDREQLAAFARELGFQKNERAEQDRRTELLARKKAQAEAEAADERRRTREGELHDFETALHQMETTPVPWSFELVEAHASFDSNLRRLSESMTISPELRESMTARADRMYMKRMESEAMLGVERPRRGLATSRAMRIRSCQNSCTDRSVPCRQSCTGLPRGACDVCNQVLRQCQTTCVTTTHRA